MEQQNRLFATFYQKVEDNIGFQLKSEQDSGKEGPKARPAGRSEAAKR